MWECDCSSRFTFLPAFFSSNFLSTAYPIPIIARNAKEYTLTEAQLIPAPRGTGLVASPAVKRLLQLAGVEDAYTSSAGSTKTLENTLKATFVAVGNTYGFLTPNLWKETKLVRSPLDEFADVLREGKRY